MLHILHSKASANRLLSLPIASVVLATLSACSSNDPSSNTSTVNLSFSDAAVDNADKVVVTVESITFQRSDEDDIVVETFVADDSQSTNNNTFEIDLLEFQGEDSRLVVDSVELPVGEYTDMIIDVLDENIENSYVLVNGEQKELKVPSDTLKLGGFSVNPTSSQNLIVEFGLQQSMTYNPGPDRYILKPRGVRIVALEAAAVVNGNIDHAALQSMDATCVATGEGENIASAGNVYLYEGAASDTQTLADNFDASLESSASNYLTPIASASLSGQTFTFSYLEPGTYTLAVSCHDQDDDADLLQQLGVPNPPGQSTQFELIRGQSLDCNIPLSEQGC